MARKVAWSHEATKDLKALVEYIERDSSFYAAAFAQEIQDATRFLNELSERGRIVPELGHPNVRELFVREYRIIYSIEESRAVILGLIHGKRDLKKLWDKEKRG
ncbi:MAG: type II toxin-antitoxin system RelE/ParE family toxin [Candidatus Manganitrophus sp.]|nr:type II toxin-antitoxin system RelE/ParE family toxin [Candidatus Manganitrophus sp.]MDC4224759.1 type II toxin-antitoxin system RelE/ParE family toxin [Candidatus Manganitrophus sp.]WDT70350.1 MAG: type II toxin-antitoxin system RelE/ParE family toxin [Candidatus Manganitrophus sp.]WDT77386.1 MAG: type II toxin-antitoxin system RelE/ParE family toxin [Candidatus Manganitrophus sp.]WDT82422.1 MAG: type II toxin-antitoxin system RelE/ParE family toxin [Candidatus Manganitrophus sp.]